MPLILSTVLWHHSLSKISFSLLPITVFFHTPFSSINHTCPTKLKLGSVLKLDLFPITWLLNIAEESHIFGLHPLKIHFSNLRSSVFSGSCVLLILQPPSYSSKIKCNVFCQKYLRLRGKNSFSFLLSDNFFFPICINPFFFCSLNSVVTCLLRCLASLFPSLAVC